MQPSSYAATAASSEPASWGRLQSAGSSWTAFGAASSVENARHLRAVNLSQHPYLTPPSWPVVTASAATFAERAGNY